MASWALSLLVAIRKFSVSMRLTHSTREKTESSQPRNARRSSVLLIYASLASGQWCSSVQNSVAETVHRQHSPMYCETGWHAETTLLTREETVKGNPMLKKQDCCTRAHLLLTKTLLCYRQRARDAENKQLTILLSRSITEILSRHN